MRWFVVAGSYPDAQAPPQGTAVARRCELRRIGPQVDRRHGWRGRHADGRHHLACERRRPGRVGDDPGRAPEDVARRPALGHALGRLLSLAQQVTAVDIDEVGGGNAAHGDLDGVSTGTDVAEVDDVDPIATEPGEVSRPGELRGEALGGGEGKRLADDAVGFPSIEGRRAGRGHGGDDDRLGGEAAAQFDVSARHATEVRGVVLRDEEVTHGG